MNIIEAVKLIKTGKKIKRKGWISYLKNLENVPIPYWYDENFKKELYADLTLEIDDYLADDWEVVEGLPSFVDVVKKLEKLEVGFYNHLRDIDRRLKNWKDD